jgi:hypothetical protein
MFRGLATGDDTNVVTALGMCDRHDLIVQETERKKPLLSVGLARVSAVRVTPLKIFSASTKSMSCFFRLARRFVSSQANMR